jgi:protein-L-isoaspartate O-methyltransferase
VTGVDDADRAYLARVRGEIDEEVRRRRASGDLPPQLESELEQLFLKHAPLGSTRQELHEVLRLVDRAAFIDPVVPVESSRPAGAVVKKGIRSMNFWYLRFITHQVSQFATAVSRSLHILDQQMSELAGKVEAVEVPPSVVVDIEWAHRRDAWWFPTLTTQLEGCDRRVLHAACGGGWLVAVLAAMNIDAYGVDPRPGRVADQELGDLDLREEPVLDHLEAVQADALGGVVMTGLFEGSGHGERRRLIEGAVTALAPGGVLVVHSLAPSSWDDADAPPEADIVQARPYRPGTWPHLLSELGLEVKVTPGPDGRDYLVVGRRPRAVPRSR